MDSEATMPEVRTSQEIFRPTTWQEIRNSWLQTPYSEHYAAAVKKFKEWESTPKVGVDEHEWNMAVNRQITGAKDLLTSYRTPQANMVETNKIVAVGVNRPEYRQDTTTRMYIGLDPRRTTQAYRALLEQLESIGVLKDIEVALQLESLESRKVQGNMIIVYDPLSRPDVLEKILTGYRNAKNAAPKAFDLTPRQRAKVMRENLQLFKATIDATLSFVEMPAEEGGRSYDSGGVQDTYKAFGIRMGEYTDEEWLKLVSKRENNRVVYTYADKQKIEKGETKPGDMLHYKRKLTAPALVQYGTVTVR